MVSLGFVVDGDSVARNATRVMGALYGAGTVHINAHFPCYQYLSTEMVRHPTSVFSLEAAPFYPIYANNNVGAVTLPWYNSYGAVPCIKRQCLDAQSQPHLCSVVAATSSLRRDGNTGSVGGRVASKPSCWHVNPYYPTGL